MFDVIDFENQTVKCIGYSCAIVRDFSSVLNYKYRINVFLAEEKRSLFPKMLWQILLFSQAFNIYTVVGPEDDECIMTRPMFYVEHFIAIPPGEEFNGYEKMVLPFDVWTWIWIGITFAIAFSIIFALRFTRSSVSSFVIGRGTLTPVLNLVRAFFGISQIVCPERSFARYLLMMFILFSLVIRTAYQGVMFEFLQKEMRKPTVTTIDEAIDQNFTFYMMQNFKEYFETDELVQR